MLQVVGFKLEFEAGVGLRSRRGSVPTEACGRKQADCSYWRKGRDDVWEAKVSWLWKRGWGWLESFLAQQALRVSGAFFRWCDWGRIHAG